MTDVVMYEVTQPAMHGGRQVYEPGHKFVNRDDVPEGVTVRPVVSSDPGAVAAVAAQNAAEGVRPAMNAPKGDWVSYAVSQGREPDEAEAMTKADLIASLTRS